MFVFLCRYQEETAFTEPLGPGSVAHTSPQLAMGDQAQANVRQNVRRPFHSLRRQARLDTEDPGQPLAPGNNMGKYQV